MLNVVQPGPGPDQGLGFRDRGRRMDCMMLVSVPQSLPSATMSNRKKCACSRVEPANLHVHLSCHGSDHRPRRLCWTCQKGFFYLSHHLQMLQWSEVFQMNDLGAMREWSASTVCAGVSVSQHVGFCWCRGGCACAFTPLLGIAVESL